MESGRDVKTSDTLRRWHDNGIMTPSTGGAARYFPFRAGPDADRIDHDAPTADRDEQIRAVRLESAHILTMAASRPLWLPPPIIIPFSILTDFWWVGLVITGVCVLALAVFYLIAWRARDGVRLLDGKVGVPVPGDLAEEIIVSGKAMHALTTIDDDVASGSPLDEESSRRWREIEDLHSAYLAHLHRTRRCWVNEDGLGWREAAQRLPLIANSVAQMLESVTATAALNASRSRTEAGGAPVLRRDPDPRMLQPESDFSVWKRAGAIWALMIATLVAAAWASVADTAQWGSRWTIVPALGIAAYPAAVPAFGAAPWLDRLVSGLKAAGQVMFLSALITWIHPKSLGEAAFAAAALAAGMTYVMWRSRSAEQAAENKGGPQ